MKLKGTISAWNDDRGFGFITPASGGDRVFVHIKAVQNRSQRTQLNQTVFYTLSKDKDGRPRAESVSYTERTSGGTMGAPGAFILTGVFFGALVWLTFLFPVIPVYIIALYAVVSLITFFFYAEDKAAARKGRWRVSEAALHGWSLFGGWPGALIAQRVLHHKNLGVSHIPVHKVEKYLNQTKYQIPFLPQQIFHHIYIFLLEIFLSKVEHKFLFLLKQFLHIFRIST